MIKLFILRCSVAAWRTAISVGTALQPATWRKVAAAQALLALLLLAGYWFLPQRDVKLPPVRYVEVKRMSPGTDRLIALGSVSPQSRWASFTAGPNGATLNPANALVWHSGSDVSAFSAVISGANVQTTGAGPFRLEFGEVSDGHGTTYGVGSPAALGSDENLLPGVWKRPPLSGGSPSSMVQVPSVEQQSFLDTIQKLLFLCQGVSMMIGSIFASIFGWISYHRGKADLKLKQLQILELEARLECQERERQRQLAELAKSGIIITG